MATRGRARQALSVPWIGMAMPRRPRLDLPGVPVHLVQRGVNRAAVFIDDEDRSRYLELLEVMLGALDIGIHAYVLMTNHVHLLVSAPAAGSLVQAVRRTALAFPLSLRQR